MIKIINQDITAGFQWSTSEQVWPFEKDSTGRILYCKELNLGEPPNNGQVSKAHNISSLDTRKVLSWYGILKSNTNSAVYDLNGAWDVGAGYRMVCNVGTTTCTMNTDSGTYLGHTAYIRIIYSK